MRTRLAWICIAAGVLVCSCATQSGSMDSELESARDDARQRLEAVDVMEESIRGELDRFEQLSDDLVDLRERTAGMELPFSLLRLVAMNCINAEYDGGASEVVDLGGRPLTCRPAHLGELKTRLQQRPTVEQDLVYDLLYAVDQARLLRGSLRRRLARFPNSIEEHREFIADERARLRQLETDMEQERNVYSTREWSRVNEQLDDYRTMLEKLEGRLEEVESDAEAWPERVDDVVTAIYFELAYMRRLADSAPEGSGSEE